VDKACAFASCRGDVQDDGAAYTVSVSGSQGIQSGSGSVQNNTYVHQGRPDPESFTGLNPRTAADRILKLPYDDALHLLSSMAPQETSEIIEVLLGTDEAKVVVFLSDLSPRRVTKLTGLLTGSAKWLASIPEAAEAISRAATELGWPSTGGLTRLDTGFHRKYPEGRIVWSKFFKTYAVTGDIEARFAADYSFGFPAGPQKTADKDSPFGTSGNWQPFASGVVYSSGHGTYLVPNSGAYDEEGGSEGWLGFPVAETTVELDELGSVQRFEGGAIFAHQIGEVVVALAVRGDVIEALPDPRRCWPVSKAVTAVSPLGNSGQVQRFLLNARSDGGREANTRDLRNAGVDEAVAWCLAGVWR
jgi:hypothetical protein